MQFFSWLLDLDNIASIEAIKPVLSARWAERGAFWILLATVGCMLAAVFHYRVFQDRGSLAVRTLLGIVRGTLLGLLLLTLALPALRLQVRQIQFPTVYWIFDGTDSMAIRDNLSQQQRADLDRIIGHDADESPDGRRLLSRMQYVQRWLQREDSDSLARSMVDSPLRSEAFLFDGSTTSRLRPLSRQGPSDLASVADQLTTDGQVTALGTVLREMLQQPGADNLAAVVLFSDFGHNSGAPPVLDDQRSALLSMDVPVHTVGVGPEESLDLIVELQTDAKIKRGERTSLVVQLRHTGMDQRRVGLTVTGRPLDRQSPEDKLEPLVIQRQEVTLETQSQSLTVAFVPERSGQWEIVARAEEQPGEVISQNNRSARQVTVIDDYLRLLYVAHEPTWEWRFIKEVFHRDNLVGINGFRTYLESSDPQVRRSNVLFVESLTSTPAEFFQNDVIFLGDMPRASIGPRFAEMVQHFVGQLGGGLVIIAGPRFGPGELLETSLAEMLPVYLEQDSQLRDDREFQLQLTPQADQFLFMNLRSGEAADEPGWDNLGPLPWYQPIAAVHPQATVLAEHPDDVCRDGRTRQPLIALRRYGKGEVVFLGFNELWRLRRGFGERYYRRFWSQLIYRLGMSHAIGDEKRFVLRTDRRQYRVGDLVTLTVEAYNENYEPFGEDDLPPQGLLAEVAATSDGLAAESRTVSVPLMRAGVCEVQLPVSDAGRFRLRVTDPLTGKDRQTTIHVTDASAERQSAVRNVSLQREISRATGGQAYDLQDADKLAKELDLAPIERRVAQVQPLWNTPLWFILIVGLMLSEWLGRRMVDLR